ncbi:MAG: ABC transporter permease [Desulfurococcales archaeon]|nr:ABC transporter permease [Desulfurococcales archaeon]
MGLASYVASRIFQALIVIFLVMILNFIIISTAPGDPVQFIAGDIAIGSPEVLNYLRSRWGLDRPLHERLLIYLGNILRGDLGYSYRYSQPVASLILERLPATLALTITSNLLAFAIGIVLGVVAARRAGEKLDNAISVFNLFLWSVPSFWLGIVLMAIFSVQLRLLPASGLMDVRNPKEGLWLYIDIAYHSFLPIATLTLITLPLYFKIVRDTVIQQASEDYVQTYRAIGIGEGEIYRKVILRNSIIPPVTVFAIHMGFAVAGAALIENVFGWPGVGRLLLDAIRTRDYPVIMGTYLVITTTVIIANLIVDLLYARLDPRVKIRAESGRT